MTNITNPQTPFNQYSQNTNVEIPKNIPPNNLITPSSVTISPTKKSNFGLFVTIGLILTVLIYSVVAYLYFQNQKIKNGANNSGVVGKNVPTITPTPQFLTENIKVQDGNITYKEVNSDSKILVNKNDFSGSGITGFLKLAVSPDKNKICFESWAPAPKPAIYISNIDGSNALEISTNRKNCTWTPDSNKLFYVNTVNQNSVVDIYLYDVLQKNEKNITFNVSETAGKKSFEIVGLSADGTTLICNFEFLGSQKQGGQCEINLTTLEVSYQ